MKYVGSKNRHSKEILQAITTECGGMSGVGKYQNWIEPFVGGANMIDKVYGFIKYGSDVNPFLISMFQAVQKGWKPPEDIDEETYNLCKENSKLCCGATLEEKALIGFVGIGCSYSGKWFGGYARGNANNGQPRNYCKESRDNLLKQTKHIKDVKFICSDYQALTIPITPSIIYCDPPYQDTTKYHDSIRHKEFWNWCNNWVERGNKVFVSEYNAPEGWRCIWEKVVNSSLTKETGSKKATEKLFTK